MIPGLIVVGTVNENVVTPVPVALAVPIDSDEENTPSISKSIHA